MCFLKKLNKESQPSFNVCFVNRLCKNKLFKALHFSPTVIFHKISDKIGYKSHLGLLSHSQAWSLKAPLSAFQDPPGC